MWPIMLDAPPSGPLARTASREQGSGLNGCTVRQRRGYGDDHEGQLPARLCRGRASYSLAGRRRLTRHPADDRERFVGACFSGLDGCVRGRQFPVPRHREAQPS